LFFLFILDNVAVIKPLCNAKYCGIPFVSYGTRKLSILSLHTAVIRRTTHAGFLCDKNAILGETIGGGGHSALTIELILCKVIGIKRVLADK
jgi:hypothetical protein